MNDRIVSGNTQAISQEHKNTVLYAQVSYHIIKILELHNDQGYRLVS
jgi:hypothetical protein